MPGGPKECRRHAARCAELTVAARTPQSRTTFLGLPKNWEKLAINWKTPSPNAPKAKLSGRASKGLSMRLNGFVA